MQPDLAVLDVVMPDLGGLDVLNAFTREGLDTRVLFLSGNLSASTSYDLIESAPQIAGELHLSPSTIKTHLQRRYERLQVSDRAAAVAEDMRRGLIE